MGPPLEEGVGGEIAPAVDDGGEEGVGSGEILEDALGGIIEGATEAREITDGRLFAASLGDGALGFAFEVDDDELVTGIENLTEMKVAVGAELGGGDGVRGEGMDFEEERGWIFEEGKGERARGGVEMGELLGELEEEIGGGLEEFGGELEEIGWGEGFRGEVRVVGIGSEGEMELAGGGAELVGTLEEVGLDFFGGGGVVGDDGVELLGELESSPIPGVAFFGDYGHGEGEDDGGGGGGGGGVEFDGTGVGGDLGEMALGEELEDFGVGIDAWLEAAEDFEENLLVVEDGGVGLFGGEEDGMGSGAEGVAWESEDGT